MKTLIIFNKNLENLKTLIKSLKDNVFGKNEIIVFDQNNKLKNIQIDAEVIGVNNLKNDLISKIKDDLNINFLIIDENKFCYDKFEINEIDDCLKNDEIFCFSLSLGKNITFCSNMNCENIFKPIEEKSGILYWDWSIHYMDFGYPLNLDGTIYRGKELFKFLKNINFENSLELENSLQIFDNYPKNIMSCYDSSKIIEVIFENKEEIINFDYNNLKIDRTKFIIESKIKNEITS